MFRGDEDKIKAIVLGGGGELEGADLAESVVFVLSSPGHMQVHDILIRPTSQVP